MLQRLLRPEAFDHLLDKIPHRRFQPFIIENAHIECLVPVPKRNELDAGMVFYAFTGNEGHADTSGYKIQCGTRGVYRTNDSFVHRCAAGPLFETLTHIEYLLVRGKIRRLTDEGGKACYTVGS